MKLKKIFTALMAASLGISAAFMPACQSSCSANGGGHTHTYSDLWSSDSQNHWHAATCEHTDLRSDVAAHSDGDGDGKCDACGYIMGQTQPEHTHTFESAWTSDDTGHWHAATCEHSDQRSGYAAHSDGDGDGKCDACGYIMEQTQPEHTHTFESAWTSDETGHWHAATCEHSDLKSGYAAHSDGDGDGKCDVCGYNTGTESGEQTLVTYSYIGQESAAFEWTSSDASSDRVEYRLSATDSFTAVDEELIRQLDSDTARVDIVGLKGGNAYDFRIVSGGVTYIKSGVTVSSYDRSGYAHFGATEGVGGYNDDGTPKSGAVIVYVTEQTKNTVTARLGGKTYTGIVSILQNAAKNSTPLIVRIIGTVGAATWNEITYQPQGDKLTAEEVTGINGKQLPTDKKDIFQSELIEGGYNTLNTSIYSELNGLTSKATYSGGEYDSAWNNCIVQNASDITVEGIGEDARIFQWGLTFKNCSSIEVRNITFEDYTEDACSVEAGDTSATSAADFEYGRIWIHHNTFEEGRNYWDVCAEQDKHEGDGATDFKGIKDVTVSYNEYHNNHKTGLVGGSNSHTTANLTYHHNFYNQCNSRMPLARQANIHIYNNYYYGSTGTNMSLRASAYAFIENCYFDNAKNPIVSETDATYGSGYAKIYGCIFVGHEIDDKYSDYLTVVTDREQTVFSTTKFGQNFDTDSAIFYYDEANNRSDVENMLTAEEVRTLVPVLAGVMSRSGDTGGDVGGTTTPDEGEGGGTTTPDEGEEGGQTTPPQQGESGEEVQISAETAQAYATGDVMATLSVGGSEIAVITAACDFTDKSTHCQAGGGSKAVIFNIELEEGYEYTITLKVGSSGSPRTLTLIASGGSGQGTQESGEGTTFLDCVWQNLAAGTYTLTQSANIRLHSITICATPLS